MTGLMTCCAQRTIAEIAGLAVDGGVIVDGSGHCLLLVTAVVGVVVVGGSWNSTIFVF